MILTDDSIEWNFIDSPSRSCINLKEIWNNTYVEPIFEGKCIVDEHITCITTSFIECQHCAKVDAHMFVKGRLNSGVWHDRTYVWRKMSYCRWTYKMYHNIIYSISTLCKSECAYVCKREGEQWCLTWWSQAKILLQTLNVISSLTIITIIGARKYLYLHHFIQILKEPSPFKSVNRKGNWMLMN